MRLRSLLLPFLALLGVCCLGAAKKDKNITVRFHLEAQKQDGESFVTPLPGGGVSGPAYIKKIPELSEFDIKSIYPFPAADGTMGCAFRFDTHGRIALDTLSVENKGRVLIAIVGARPVSAMFIDRRVSDGVIMLSRGLTPEEIAKLEKRYPVMGAKKKK